jgi:hypothetical protein
MAMWKYQVPSTKFQINPNHPNSKQNLFGNLKLEFGAYFGFGICDLGFQRLCALQAGTDFGDIVKYFKLFCNA